MPVLVDAGPLIGLLVGADTHHAQAVSLFERAPRPWLTCEAVLSEAFFILRRGKGSARGLRALLERGALGVAYSARGEERELTKLLKKYEDVPMSFADACLLRMSEQNPRLPLLTFDDDFSVYRRADRRAVPRLK